MRNHYFSEHFSALSKVMEFPTSVGVFYEIATKRLKSLAQKQFSYLDENVYIIVYDRACAVQE